MTAFPSLYYTEGSTIETISGRQTVRATNGALRIRQLYSADKKKFNLEFWGDSTKKQQILDHYSTDKDSNFEYTDPLTSVTYTVMYVDAPQCQPQLGTGWKVVVRLEEV